MKKTMICRVADVFCPHYCMSCGASNSLFCERCKNNLELGCKVCLKCGKGLVDGCCTECSLPFERQFCLGERRGILKNLINVYKYNSVRSAKFVLADLCRVFSEEYDFNDAVFVPLPTISKHLRERGFGHIESLAKELARNLGGRSEKVLKRVNSSVQVGSSSEQRERHAKEAYAVRSGFKRNERYILVDDVWTTGSSMIAAAQKLRSQGAQSIDILVLAKTIS